MAIGDPHDPGLPAARAVLEARGATLEVHPATGPGPEERDAEDTQRLPDAACHFRSPGLHAALRARLRREPPDLVHIEEMVMAQYLDAIDRPRVIDRQKVEWAYHEALAEAGGARAAWHRLEAARFRRWEQASAMRFDTVLVAGESDRALLAPYHGASRIEVVPLGVDDAFHLPPERTRHVEHVLLYGVIDYPPNVEANAFFFREVWPRLARARPGLAALVMGAGQTPESLPVGDPRVQVRGYVEDAAAVLGGPGVLVVPLRVGGGSRTKVLEALACGMPVVSTAIGVENLGLTSGQHYLPAETPEEIAAAVMRLGDEPALVEALGRAGAAHVEEGFRWPQIAVRLEPVYARIAAPQRSPLRALLVGVHPLPGSEDARGLSFPGHRTAQFAAALAAAGCTVEAALRDEEGDGAASGARLLSPAQFGAGEALQTLHDSLRPDLVVAAGGYHAARAVVQLKTEAPRWIDLAGDLAAEGQLRAAEDGDGALRDALAVLAQALLVGDRFSVVGPSQRLALLGQLGLAGRLTPETVGEEPIAVVPLSAEGPTAPPPLPEGGLQILWSGSYNAWMDAETLWAALEQVLARRPEVVFASTGGAVPGHAEDRHAAFWRRASASPLAPRLRDHGRLPRGRALEVLACSHVVVCTSRPCLEAELGSRQRLVEALAYGRPVVATASGDLAREIERGGAGLVVPPSDPAALAAALLRLAEDRTLLASCARGARALWEAMATPARAAAPLRAWAAEPRRWPGSVLAAPRAADTERLRLQAEITAIRGSRTFRALRLVDRLLGRGRR
jgi:glycosyltransferase involved in cell wall biosynthesis